MGELLRRGFKTQAELLAQSVRSEMGLEPIDPLDCFALAAGLGIPIVSLKELLIDGAERRHVEHLLVAGSFSAATVCRGTRRLIIYNSAHPPGRRANSLAHELSHPLLEHPAAPALGVGGCRLWDPELEAEADWLAATLLVLREGALAWLRRGGSIADGAQHFGVSDALFRWRVNQTGVSNQFRATGRRWAVR